jgi:predicted secreted Zn-dependent protease
MFRCVKAAVILAAMLMIRGNASAQSSYTLSTNYFWVAGDNMRQIRESLRASRPFKEPFDALTSWDIRWNFKLVDSDGSCRCTSFSTKTTITIFLPKWRIPANPLPETVAAWTNLFMTLAEHELGHARFAIDATEQVQRAGASISSGTDCAKLRADVNAAAQAVVNDYRRREREYDERTQHGTAGFTNAPPRR